MVYLGIISKKGEEWVSNNVDYESWQGSLEEGGIYMETRYVDDILESAKADGLTPDDIYFANTMEPHGNKEKSK